MALETKKPNEKPDEKVGTGVSDGKQEVKAPEAQAGLPEKLAKLGFNTEDDVISFMQALDQDRQKAKTMYDGLLKEREAPKKSPLDEIPDEEFLSNPKAAVVKAAQALLDKQYEERVAPLGNQLIEGKVAVQKMELLQHPDWGPLMRKHSKDVDEFLKTVHPNLKAQDGSVLTALQYVVGRNLPKILKESQEMRAAGVGTEGGSASGSEGSKEERKPAITDPDEARVVALQIQRGVFKDEAEYLEWRNKK
jgi:hypothetical protein